MWVRGTLAPLLLAPVLGATTCTFAEANEVGSTVVAAGATTQWDLSCRLRYPGASYHQLHDCMLPNICAIAQLQATNGSACYDVWQTRWIHLLAPRATRNTSCPPRPEREDRCATYDTLQALLPRHNSTKPSTTVLLHRSNTRIFDAATFSALLKSLKRLGPVVVFTGHENTEKAARIFQNTRYLVGYHGAGFTNTFFMKNLTRILEISTYQDENNTKPWRSNVKEVTKYGRYITRVLRVPIQQLLVANNATSRAEDPDHFVKGLRWVRLDQKNIDEIVAFGAHDHENGTFETDGR